MRLAAAALTAVLLAAALAACGSASSTSSSAVAAAGGGPNSAAVYKARLKFAECMRAHGVNLPDPSASGGPGAGGGGGLRSLRTSPNFQPALQACRKYRIGGFANISPAQRAQFQAALVKFAQCMRAHNVDIPDPSTSSGGGFGIFRQISPSERQSPAFQTAVRACASTLPFRRGGAGGAGPGGGGGGFA